MLAVLSISCSLGEFHFVRRLYVASVSLLTAELGDHPQYAKSDVEGETLCLHFTHINNSAAVQPKQDSVAPLFNSLLGYDCLTK